MTIQPLLTLSAVCMAICMSALCAPTTHALPVLDDTMTLITGKVTRHGSNSGVTGVPVTVSCNEHLSEPARTSNAGVYSVTFLRTECPNGAAPTARANKDGEHGAGSSTVENFAALNANIILTSVEIVPEFGVVTGLAGLMAGAGVLYFIRSRQSVQ